MQIPQGTATSLCDAYKRWRNRDSVEYWTSNAFLAIGFHFSGDASK